MKYDENGDYIMSGVWRCERLCRRGNGATYLTAQAAEYNYICPYCEGKLEELPEGWADDE